MLGVIPARGGSKRVRKKNLRLLHDKPLIVWTIEAARKSRNLTDWVVTTDSVEIAQVASSSGAKVHVRDEMDDNHTSGKACLDALRHMEGEPYDMVVLLHPTSPIRSPKHIDEAIEKLSNSGLDYLASVRALPVKRHANVLVDNRLRANGFVLNASIYAIKRDALIETESHVGQEFIPLVMDRYHSLDIDEEIDLKIAELYLSCLGH